VQSTPALAAVMTSVRNGLVSALAATAAVRGLSPEERIRI
jgi:hypothetical protein